jgi:SAM-dependent methyltransferase
MKTGSEWIEDAYFESSPASSIDGGGTDRGALWHAISPRWGHAMHTMCSYQGMFPARLAHYFLQQYTEPGARILDPISGRGTTILQARAEGRRAIGGDLSPLAFVLTRAKAAPPSWSRFMRYLDDIESSYARGHKRLLDLPAVSKDIRMLFHPRTLDQLLFLRQRLTGRPWSRWSDCDYMAAGCVAGILHGTTRSDGTSAYLSISMPNTFSMSPSYVRNYIRTNRLRPLEQNVFEMVRDKAARLYQDDTRGHKGTVYLKDANALLRDARAIPPGSIDLLVTSPPYLKVVNYGTANWIRLWWLGVEDVGRQGGTGRLALDARLDHRHTMDSYSDFMLKIFRNVGRVLRADGVAVFVIGDVAEPGRPAIPLATRLWERMHDKVDLKLFDVIVDRLPAQNKVSRIWGETRGQATDWERILVLGRSGSSRTASQTLVEWEEPYLGAGRDAAHRRLVGPRSR